MSRKISSVDDEFGGFYTTCRCAVKTALMKKVVAFL